MADETKPATAKSTPMPAAPFAEPAPPTAVSPPAVEPVVAADRDTPFTAAERIRAFEDEHVGKDAVRIGGRIERGSGSPFAALDDEHKRHYAALEKIVDAEQKLAAAHAALIQADIDHDAALAAAEPKPNAE